MAKETAEELEKRLKNKVLHQIPINKEAKGDNSHTPLNNWWSQDNWIDVTKEFTDNDEDCRSTRSEEEDCQCNTRSEEEPPKRITTEDELVKTLMDMGVEVKRMPSEKAQERAELLAQAKESVKSLSENDKKDILGALSATKNLFRNLLNEKIADDTSGPGIVEGDDKILSDFLAYKKRINNFIEHHPAFPKQIAKAICLDEYGDGNNREEPLAENEKAFKQIVDKMFDTYKRKNADYGSSFDQLFDEYGFTSVNIRLTDKLNRLKSLTESPDKKAEVKDESLEDTLLDLANYAILAILALRKAKK